MASKPPPMNKRSAPSPRGNLKTSPKNKKSIEGWSCVQGRGVNIAYSHNGTIFPEDRVPQEVKDAIYADSLKCKEQRVIQAGAAGKKLTDTAKEYQCEKKPGDGEFYRHKGRLVDYEAIPKEIRDLITCKASAQAYHEPEKIGKTRSQTQYICKGGLFGKDKVVSEDEAQKQKAKGRKCSPK